MNTLSSQQKDHPIEKFSAVALPSVCGANIFFQTQARRITDICFWTGVLINLNLIKTANEAKDEKKNILVTCSL